MLAINIYKAQNTAGMARPDTQITITEELPDLSGTMNGNSESEWRPIMTGQFEREATALENALYNSLPGGTYDALFHVMAKRTASVLVVSHAS